MAAWSPAAHDTRDSASRRRMATTHTRTLGLATDDVRDVYERTANAYVVFGASDVT